MPHEMMVAMNVTDANRYAEYRAGMAPILARYGGGFRCDFVVSASLTATPAHPVTRVFAIYFPSESASQEFFVDPAYQAIKQARYEGAVDGFTIIASYTTSD